MATEVSRIIEQSRGCKAGRRGAVPRSPGATGLSHTLCQLLAGFGVCQKDLGFARLLCYGHCLRRAGWIWGWLAVLRSSPPVSLNPDRRRFEAFRNKLVFDKALTEAGFSLQASLSSPLRAFWCWAAPVACRRCRDPRRPLPGRVNQAVPACRAGAAAHAGDNNQLGSLQGAAGQQGCCAWLPDGTR